MFTIISSFAGVPSVHGIHALLVLLIASLILLDSLLLLVSLLLLLLLTLLGSRLILAPLYFSRRPDNKNEKFLNKELLLSD
jgi:hypothetical protein